MNDSEQCFGRLTRLAEKSLLASRARICLDEEHRRFLGGEALSRDTLCERARQGNDPTLLTTPVVLGDRAIGLFVVERSSEFTDADRQLAAHFARTAAAEIELEMAVRENESHAPHVEGDRPRLLVVEDDETMLKLIARDLESEGYDVTEASNGREALDAARAGNFDLMILDLVMPDLSGWDVLQYRATDPRLQAMPVVIVSARRGPDVARAMAFGVDGLVPKPFAPADLRHLVRTCLRERRVTASA